MAHPLDGVHQKLARARSHFAWLEWSFDEFVQGDPETPFGSFTDTDRKTGLFTTRWVDHPPVPLEWSVVIGEILYAMRSSLDHLAWQLVIANGREPDDKTEFPIFQKVNGFNRSAPSKMAGMSDEAKTVIADLQPFRVDPEHPTHSTLWKLHELGIVDKHRLLNLVDFWMDEIRLEVVPEHRRFVRVAERWSAPRVRLAKGLELARLRVVPLTTFKGTVDAVFSAWLDVAFDEGTFLTDERIEVSGGMGVRQLLITADDYLTNSLIPAFDPFFPSRESSP